MERAYQPRTNVRDPKGTRAPAAIVRPQDAMPRQFGHPFGNLLQKLAPLPTAGAPIQRVITFTAWEREKNVKETNAKVEVDDVFARIVKGREAQSYIKALKQQQGRTDDEAARGLRELLLTYDGGFFDSLNALLTKLKAATSDVNKGGTGASGKRQQFIRDMSEIAQKSGASELIHSFFSGSQLQGLYYKLRLVAEVGGGADVQRLLFSLAAIWKMQARIGMAGVGKTLGTLAVSSDWNQDPEAYIVPYGTDKDASLAGFRITIQGLIAETDAIASAAEHVKLAEGESVFSASKYSDSEKGKIEEDVDVSYIDAKGVLHLVEVAKDVKALGNKAAEPNLALKDPAGQKQRYQYLATRSTSVVHQPVEPLTEQQQERQSISDVVFAYAIPRDVFERDKKANPQKAVEVLGDVIRSGAILILSGKTYSTADLRELRSQIKY